ncbi:MAG: efflux RND transporter periplasmic adaptor subunit [Acidobacteria bacterium]|nr:efflux RND transporter periplasmic adaptor subunit [Acidobacteriota bacterium]
MKRLGMQAAIQRLTWVLAAALALWTLTGTGCGSGGANSKGGPPSGMGAGKGGRMGGPGLVSEVVVQTTSVQRISIQRQVDLAGSLISPDQAKVSSEVAGVVRQVLVELGQEVGLGQVVVKLDHRELDLALQRARSQLRQTEAQLGIDGVRFKEPPPDEQISSIRMAAANRDDALAQLRRAQRLKSQNLLSQADLDTAETKVKVTEANYQAALETVQSLKAILQERRHAVELAEKKLNDTDIRASVAGQVSERLVQQGEYIRENTPVVTIVQMNPLKLKTAIQERHAGTMRVGLPVEFSVESSPGQKFKGRVANVSPSVDQATRTFSVEILVDNRDRQLKPGFFAKGVIFTHSDENVMAVPEYAVSTLAGVSNVYVIENGKARQQMVSLGPRVGNLHELISGLDGNEILAASNLTLLATGVPVKIAQGGRP